MRSFFYPLTKRGNDLAVLIVIIMVFVQKANISDCPASLKVFQPVIDLLQHNGWWIAFVASGTVVTTKIVLNFVSSPQKQTAIQEVLDNARKYLIDGTIVINDPAHHHRVTLFQYRRLHFFPRPLRKWYWWWGKMRSPFSGWLVPVARSGHTTKKIKSSFLAPDDADAAEGFAGQAWSMNQTVFQDGLKSINASSCEDDVLDYANRTWVGTWWVDLKRKEKKPMCKALCGIPISVSGELWGVLVVDSTKPKAILDPNSVTTQVMQLEFILGKVIKGA